MVDLGHGGSFRVRAGVKTSLVRLDGTVAARLRYHLDGTVASAFFNLGVQF